MPVFLPRLPWPVARRSPSPNAPTTMERVGRRWALRWVLTVPFVLFACTGVLAVGWVSLRNGERAVNDLADRLHGQLRERIGDRLGSYFHQPKQAIQVFRDSLDLKLLDPNNLDQLGEFSWRLRRTFAASYVNYGLTNGVYIGAGMGTKGVMIVSERSARLNWGYEEYATDAAGRRSKVLDRYPFDHRNESWFQRALKTGRPGWSEIYAWDGAPQFVSINYGLPLRDGQGQIMGAIGVDLLLDEISTMLREIKLHPQLKIALLERDGSLVGSSTGEALFSLRPSPEGPKPERVRGQESRDRTLRAAVMALNQQGGPAKVNQPRTLLFTLDGQQQVLWLSPWRDADGLNWTIVATLPESAFMERIAANTRLTVLLCALALALVVLLGLVTARKLTAQVRALGVAAGYVARGQAQRRAERSQIRELDDLATAFNRMAEELQASFAALESTNQLLESRVQERTATLTQTLIDLQSTQAQLIQTEKMSSLGQMVAGIAHEINNPVGFIHGNLGILRQYIQELVEILGARRSTIYVSPNANHGSNLTINSNTANQNTANQNTANPNEDLEFLLEDLPKLVHSMEEGTRRIQEIVNGLQNFSRLDQSDRKPADLNDGLDSTLMLLSHRFKQKGHRPEITVRKVYGQLPLVWCFPGQLNQVFMNLLANAVDALDEAAEPAALGHLEQRSPEITLVTRAVGQTGEAPASVEISIRDNGAGIPRAVVEKIFDPFFTTKPVGKGTGLGLAIAYQIVRDRHGGKITCHSTPHRGTTFILSLPVGQPAADPLQVDDSV